MKVTGTDGKEYTIEPGVNLTGDNLSYAGLRGAILKSQKTNKWRWLGDPKDDN